MIRLALTVSCAALVASPVFGQDVVGPDVVRPDVVGSDVVRPDLARYRSHVLESSVASVVTTLGIATDRVHVMYEQPARIQELEWRSPYVDLARMPADPVRMITFRFLDDALYQILVEYDASRTDGMTNTDLVAALSATYGAPAPGVANRRLADFPDSVALAKWDSTSASVTLLRSRYGPGTQLLLVSTLGSQRARAAIQESLRLDALDTPRREAAQRKQELVDEAAARERLREANRAGFRP